MTAESKPFYRVTCNHEGCTAVLTDGEHEWWDEGSVRDWLVKSNWTAIDVPLATLHYCNDHWVSCDYCMTPMPTGDGDIPNFWSCQNCADKHNACHHKFTDEGYANWHGAWVKVITCQQCAYIDRERVKP